MLDFPPALDAVDTPTTTLYKFLLMKSNRQSLHVNRCQNPGLRSTPARSKGVFPTFEAKGKAPWRCRVGLFNLL